MKNYISINGNRTELTEAQIKELGFKPPQANDEELKSLLDTLREGNAHIHYSVGERLTLCEIELEIIGFNHDKAYCSHDLDTITLMGVKTLSPRRFHGGACERGWIDSELREWLNAEYYDSLPEQLRQCLVEVEKLTHNYNGERFCTKDVIFIPSESELFGSAIWSDNEDGERYEVFKNRHARIRVDENGDEDWYWTRSAHGGTSTHFAAVDSNGHAHYTSATHTTVRVPLCFTIA